MPTNPDPFVATIATTTGAYDDLVRRAEVALAYWRYFYNDEALSGDPAAVFCAEFEAYAKQLGLIPIEPRDVEPEVNE